MDGTRLFNSGTLTGGLIVALGLLAFVLLRPVGVAGSSSTVLQPVGQPTGISVTGEGKLTLVPDMATVRLGVEAQACTVEEARTRAAEAMDQVIAALRGGGVAEADIKTAHFSIAPERRPGPNGVMIDSGYRVTNIVTAKVRSVGDVGRIVDAVAAAGGNLVRVDHVSFGLKDPASLQAQLRELAMGDARGKAEQLARLGGKGLGEPISIQEGAGAQPPELLRNMGQMASAAAKETFVAPGEMETRMSVQVVWAIR